MKIGATFIAHGLKPYIIAELGVNHDGSVDRAIELVDAAADAGADAVKLQYFTAQLLMSRSSALAKYQELAGEKDPRDMLRRLELSVEQMARVVKRAREKQVHAIVTVFSDSLVVAAEQLGFDAYKTASPDIIHKPLLLALGATGRPLIISTGAATIHEVSRAVEWVGPAHDRVAVLQCVSSYPTPLEHAALGGIAALRDELAIPVGYSDHTQGVETGALAVAAGACILEKHLTLDRGARGPDHAASMDPEQMKRYVAMAREAWSIVGPAKKQVLPIEADVRGVSRQSLVAARDLASGQRIGASDVIIKRPGSGIAPFRLNEIVGKQVVRAIAADTVITDADIASS